MSTELMPQPRSLVGPRNALLELIESGRERAL